MAASQIETSLRRRIGAGEWRDSGRLPNERELAAAYGVARNTVRAAIDRIAADGTLVRQVGRGTFIRSEADDFAGVLRKLAGASPFDMMSVRRIMEPRACALAATNASLGDLEAIAAAHAAACRAEPMEEFEHWDGALHQRIFAAARVDLLSHLHEILLLVRGQPLWTQIKRRSFSPARRQHYCAQHAEIVDALMQRDAGAAEAAMLAHLDSVSRNLFGGE